MRMAVILIGGLTLFLPSPPQAQRVEVGAFITDAFFEEIGSHDDEAATSTRRIRTALDSAPLVAGFAEPSRMNRLASAFASRVIAKSLDEQQVAARISQTLRIVG